MDYEEDDDYYYDYDTLETSTQNEISRCSKTQKLVTFNVTFTCDDWEKIQRIWKILNTVPKQEAGDYQGGDVLGNLLDVAAAQGPGWCKSFCNVGVPAVTGLLGALIPGGGGVTGFAGPVTPVFGAPVTPGLPEPVTPAVPDQGNPVLPDQGNPGQPDPGNPGQPDPRSPVLPSPGNPVLSNPVTPVLASTVTPITNPPAIPVQAPTGSP